MEAFSLWLKLTKIGAFAVRTLVGRRIIHGDNALIISLQTKYAVDKSKVAPAGITTAEWRVRTVSQLNAAMSQWVDSLPDHCTKIPPLPSSVITSNILSSR